MAQESDSVESLFNEFAELDNDTEFVSANDRYVVVADESYRELSTVTVFDKEGKKLTSFASQKSDGAAQFKKLSGVAITQDNHIILVEENTQRILKFTVEGNLVSAVEKKCNDGPSYDRPRGICVSHDGLIYLPGICDVEVEGLFGTTETKSSVCVEVRNPDLSFSRTIDLLYPSELDSITPKSVAVDSQGMVYLICDDKVRKYTPKGHLVTEFIANDSTGIVVDKADNVYVSCKYGHILVFGTNGRFLYAISKDSDVMIEAMAVDNAKGSLYICCSEEVFSTTLDAVVPSERANITIPCDEEGEAPFPSSYLQKLAVLDDCNDIAVTDDNLIVVTQQKQHIVIILDKDGTKIRSFGSKGTDEGQFNNPNGVAITQDGHIIVADEENHRVQKFTMEGKFVGAVGEKGTGDLQFDLPSRVFVLPSGLILVADSGNDRIQALNSDLSFSHMLLSASGDEDGEFDGLYDIAIDKDGMLYVVDLDGDQVQKLTPDGQFVAKFGRKLIKEPHSIAVDARSNVVYVSDKEREDIAVFDTSGKFLWRFGGDTTTFPEGLAVNRDGYLYFCGNQGVYVSVPASTLPHAVITGSRGNPVGGQFTEPYTLAVSQKTNHITVVESCDNFTGITVMDKQGTVIRKLEAKMFDGGKILESPNGVAFAPDDTIIVSDENNALIQKFSIDGDLVASVGSQGTGELQFDYPKGVCVHPNGKIYVADKYNNRIHVLDSDLSFSHMIGNKESGKKPLEFDRPSDVAVDSGGMVYAADMYNNRIQKFTPDGKFIAHFGSDLLIDTFTCPEWIAISGDLVYVRSSPNDHVSVFNTSGLFLANFGYNFDGLDVDESGKLFVCDKDSNCVTAF